MSDVKFNCPHCNQHLEADPTMAGTSGSCPACAKDVVIPAETKVTPPERDQPQTLAARMTIVQQLLRFFLVLVFLVATQFLTAGITAFAMYGYARATLYLLLGSSLFVAFGMLVRLQITKVCAHGKPRYVTLITPIAAACAAIAFYLVWESAPRELWVGLVYLSALITVISGLLVVARAKAFSWTCLVVVFLATSSALFVVEYRPLTAAQAAAKTNARKARFEPLLDELRKLDESEDFEAGLNRVQEDAQYFGRIPAIDGNLLVVGFKEWVRGATLVHSPFYIEGYLPPDMLAVAPSDVRVVVVVEAVHATHTAKESPLVMEVLLYAWPDRTRLACAKLAVGRKAKHTGYQVFPAATSALRRFLRVAVDASAKEDNVTKPADEAVEKVSAGMTIAAVEALLGKGTPYAEVENAKEKYGFSPTTSEGQRNTYLWFRPNDRVYVAEFTDGRLSFSFTKLPPGE